MDYKGADDVQDAFSIVSVHDQSMKLKIKISGPKVHDVGYRYFLMSMAMANRIRMFEAHNTESFY